jgi:hypothetical protein
MPEGKPAQDFGQQDLASADPASDAIDNRDTTDLPVEIREVAVNRRAVLVDKPAACKASV